MTMSIASRSVVVAATTVSKQENASAQVTARTREKGEGTDGSPLTATTREKQRARAGDLRRIASSLSPREWNILALLQEHRFLTTSHLTGLLFRDGHTATSGPVIARRTLTRLRQGRLVNTLDRRIGGVRAGSSGLIYYLSERGHRLLAHDAAQRQRRHRTTEPSTTFLTHTLAVADARLHLADAERAHGLEMVDVVIEAAAWRRYLATTGVLTTLKPDLYVELAIPPGSDELRTLFIEVDLGTEHLPTLIRKCRAYAAYATSGQAERDGGMPLVIWSLSARTPQRAMRRRQQLHDLIAHDPRLDAAMFRITDPSQLAIAARHEEEGNDSKGGNHS